MVSFLNIGLLAGLAALGGISAKLLRQPALVGFIAAGILLSLLRPFFPSLSGTEVSRLGEMGVAMLLFLVGLNLDSSRLRKVGRTAVIVAVGQILITATIGYGVANLFHLSPITCLYIGLSLTFTSTAIAVATLQERGSLDSYYGRMVVGLLLVQDLIAVLTLITLTNIDQFSSLSGLIPIIILSILKAGLIGVAALIFGRLLLPPIFRYLGRHLELLFLAALAYSLLLAALTETLGLSAEIGAFLAGISLASLPFASEIAARLRPLRDFFLTMFFISLGLSIGIPRLTDQLPLLITLSLIVVLINPLIVALIMTLLGHRSHTSLHVALMTAQIGEFAFILSQIGLTTHQLSPDIVSLIVATALISIAISSYTSRTASRLIATIKPVIKPFERQAKQEIEEEPFSDHIVLIGFRRFGARLLHELTQLASRVVVVDVNPDIEIGNQRRVSLIFGDATDEAILDKVNLSQAKAVISSVSELGDNLTILDFLKHQGHKPTVYMTAPDKEAALKLYAAGADLVIIPHEISSEYVKHLLKDLGSRKNLKVRKLHHLRVLKQQA